MIRKYGKPIDMRSIKRDLNGISALINACRVSTENYDLSGQKMRGKCAICESKNRRHFLTVYDKYHYYECQKCGALTLDQYPDPKVMYSSKESANLGLYVEKEVYAKRVNLIAKPKADYIIDIIHGSGDQPKTWLDIGSGGGELLYYLKTSDIGIKGTGLESDTAELDFCKKMGLDVYEKFIDMDNIDNEITQIIHNKDIVSFFNVLEHIEKPVEYINYLYESMKTGAWLVIEVPKHPSLGSFANLTSNNKIYRHIIPPIHLQIFSEKSLEILLEDKFEIVSIWEFGQGFMDVINNAMLEIRIEKCELYDLIADKQNEIQKAIDEAGLSDQIMIIARKGRNI